jgi:cell division protein ZapA
MSTGAQDKRLVRVVIFQQPYTVRATNEPGETEALAAAVDGLMNQIATRAGATDATRVAVLAALHLADRVRQLEREVETFLTRTRQIDDRLSHLLDEQK